MNAEPCLRSQAEHDSAPLPQRIAGQIEELRTERMMSFIRQASEPAAKPQNSRLERAVDDLLDSLSMLHRLDDLASCTVRGGRIAADEDRLLVDDNPQTFGRLVRQHQSPAPCRIQRAITRSCEAASA